MKSTIKLFLFGNHSLAIVVILLAIVGFVDYSIGASRSLEESVRKLLRSIHSRDYDMVLSIVSERGLIDADQTISKSQVGSDLRNPESYLRKSLYKSVPKSELDICCSKLRCKLIVSPWAFYERYGENFIVKYRKMEKFNDMYSVQIIAQISSTESTDCEFQLWYTMFQKHDGRYYLRHYFFE